MEMEKGFKKKHLFCIYLVLYWDVNFMIRVKELKVLLIFPIIIYEDTWIYTIYIIYWMFIDLIHESSALIWLDIYVEIRLIY